MNVHSIKEVEPDDVIPVPDPEEPEHSPMVPAPALGYSITANLGDDRQIVTQCFADSEEPLAAIHAKVDKAMAVIDRQKAKYRRIELVKQVEEMEKNHSRYRADLAVAEQNFERGQKDLEKQHAEVVAKREAVIQNAIDSGRSGPVGADKQRSFTLKSEAEKLVAERDRQVEERKFQLEQAAISLKRYEEEIAKANEQIAECDALIAGG